MGRLPWSVNVNGTGSMTERPTAEQMERLDALVVYLRKAAARPGGGRSWQRQDADALRAALDYIEGSSSDD